MPAVNISSDKFLGYLLLFIGLLIIIVSTISVIRVLDGKVQAPEVFDIEAPTIPLPQYGSNIKIPEGTNPPEGISTAQVQPTGGIKLIPDDVFNRILDISVYYLAMMFLASTGSKIAVIGVKLIKDLKVQTKG